MGLAEAAQVAQVSHDGQLRRSLDVNIHRRREFGVQSLSYRPYLTDFCLIKERDDKDILDLVSQGSVVELHLSHALDPVVQMDGEPPLVKKMQLIIGRGSSLQVEVMIEKRVPVAGMLLVDFLLNLAFGRGALRRWSGPLAYKA